MLGSNLARVFHSQLVGKDYLEYDLYNDNNVLMYKKGKKIDHDFLLKINYINVYKLKVAPESSVKTFANDDISQFLQELILLGVKDRVDEIEIKSFNDNIEIFFYKDYSLTEKADLDIEFYQDILDMAKELLDIDKAFCSKKYSDYVNVKIGEEKHKIILHLIKNSFDKHSIIIEFPEHQKQILDLQKFHLSKNNLNTVQQIKSYENGIFVVAGPEASGKNKLALSIISSFYDQSQVQIVHPEQDSSNYAELLNNISSQFWNESKNIVVIRISGKESFSSEILKLASECMIFLLVNAKNTSETITVLQKSGLLTKELFSTLKILIMQSKVRKICSHCYKKYEAPQSVLKEFFEVDMQVPVYFHRPDGCKVCFDTGYDGKLPVQEVFLTDSLNMDYHDFIKLADKKEYLYFIKENEFDDINFDIIKKALRGLTYLGELHSAKI
jgi:type II secretory ATPase GspE/PulE/Tfp pilus assembly ATPase PilB-like protein